MKFAKAVGAGLLFAGLAGGVVGMQENSAAKSDFEALKAQIEALKPKQHVWREIGWKTCPLEALKEAREENKPIVIWVFLGNPSDERC